MFSDIIKSGMISIQYSLSTMSGNGRLNNESK